MILRFSDFLLDLRIFTGRLSVLQILSEEMDSSPSAIRTDVAGSSTTQTEVIPAEGLAPVSKH